MRLQPGTLLQGDRYRIIDILGQGGFGITYLAEQIMAERKVCIKEFFPKEYYNRDEDSRSISLGTQGSAETMELYKAKFVKEAKTIAKLDHPNIIHIFDVFSENNTAYYVMEYIEGESLSDVVKRNGGALAESVAVDYIKQTASALGYIHERNIMHLDVKPANIMLRKTDGKPVLIDFGLSKQYDAEGNQTSSTPVGISAGFAPMEQYQQGGVKEFSPETDIYSLGATLYYLVTGCVPPQAAAIVDDGLPELPAHLSQGVRRAIERSMEVQRKKRPHSIKEFVALLGDGNTATIPTPTPTPVAVPTPSFADEATVIGTQTSTLDEKTVITTPTPKAEAPKKEWTPKYSTEKPKKSEERTKKKSRWWMWLLGLLLIGGGAYFVLDANSGKKAESVENENTDSDSAKGFYNPEFKSRFGYNEALNGDVESIVATYYDLTTIYDFGENGHVSRRGYPTYDDYDLMDYVTDENGNIVYFGIRRENENYAYYEEHIAYDGNIPVSLEEKYYSEEEGLYGHFYVEYYYDEDNKIIEYRRKNLLDSDLPVRRIEYHYDDNGNCIEKSCYDDDTYDLSIMFEYSKDNKLCKEYGNWECITYEYNDNKLVRSIHEYNTNNNEIKILYYDSHESVVREENYRDNKLISTLYIDITYK